jgi:hypothetical protein
VVDYSRTERDLKLLEAVFHGGSQHYEEDRAGLNSCEWAVSSLTELHSVSLPRTLFHGASQSVSISSDWFLK